MRNEIRLLQFRTDTRSATYPTSMMHWKRQSLPLKQTKLVVGCYNTLKKTFIMASKAWKVSDASSRMDLAYLIRIFGSRVENNARIHRRGYTV